MLKRYLTLAALAMAIGFGALFGSSLIPLASSAAPAAAPVTITFFDSRGPGRFGAPHSTQLYDKVSTGNLAGQVCDVELDDLNNDSGRAGSGMEIIEGAVTIANHDIEVLDFQLTRSTPVRMTVPAEFRIYALFGDEGAVSVLPTAIVSNCGDEAPTTTTTTSPASTTTTIAPTVIAKPVFTG